MVSSRSKRTSLSDGTVLEIAHCIIVPSSCTANTERPRKPCQFRWPTSEHHGVTLARFVLVLPNLCALYTRACPKRPEGLLMVCSGDICQESDRTCHSLITQRTYASHADISSATSSLILIILQHATRNIQKMLLCSSTHNY